MKREEWAEKSSDRLRGVGKTWRDEIEALQPFNRPHDPEGHELFILDYVNNLNKHRFLPAPIWALDSWRVGLTDLIGGESIESDRKPDRPIEDGAPFIALRASDRRELKVGMDQEPSVRVSFGDGLGRNWLTADLMDWVDDALTRFEPAFSS